MGWVPSEPASSPQDACLAHPPLREVSYGLHSIVWLGGKPKTVLSHGEANPRRWTVEGESVSAGVVGHVEARRIQLRQHIAACGFIERNQRWAHRAPRCVAGKVRNHMLHSRDHGRC